MEDTLLLASRSGSLPSAKNAPMKHEPNCEDLWIGPWKSAREARSEVTETDFARCRLPRRKRRGNAVGIFIEGPVLDGHAELVARFFDQAVEEANVHRIVLLCRSPFGKIGGLEKAIQSISRAKKRKEVWAYLADACGTAFLLALACEYVFASSEPRGRYGGCVPVKIKSANNRVSRGRALETQISRLRPGASWRTIRQVCSGGTLGFELAEAAELVDLSLRDPRCLTG